MEKPNRIVVDCSVAMSWCFVDELNDYSEGILEQLNTLTVYVPTLWKLEVVNVLLMAERRKRITALQSAAILDVLSQLPIEVDPTTPERAMNSIINIAKECTLTSYDAAYLELAYRENYTLATLDKALVKAAKKIGVTVW